MSDVEAGIQFIYDIKYHTTDIAIATAYGLFIYLIIRLINKITSQGDIMPPRKSRKIQVIVHEPTFKRTSIGRGKVKTSTMNKNKRRSWKKYRGQG